jgi:hypothetical protein
MSEYYSGQGKVYLAERDANGRPGAFIPLGNVPNLEVSVEVTKFEHKESMSGQRAVDLSFVQEKNGTFTMTLEEMSLDNLAMAFWGTSSAQAAGTFNGTQTVTAVVDATNSSRIALIDNATNTPYTNITTLVVGDDALGTTTYDFSGTAAAPGENGYLDASTGVLVISNQTAQAAATDAITDGQTLYLVSGGYAASTIMDAFTETSMERWLRFEGLNTLPNGLPVVVDIFKANIDPLQGYGLINEELATIEVSGSMLYDDLQPGTSKYFRQQNLSA